MFWSRCPRLAGTVVEFDDNRVTTRGQRRSARMPYGVKHPIESQPKMGGLRKDTGPLRGRLNAEARALDKADAPGRGQGSAPTLHYVERLDGGAGRITRPRPSDVAYPLRDTLLHDVLPGDDRSTVRP